MESEKKSNGFLKVIPTFGSKDPESSQLSSKDKRYVQQVEKALVSFDSLEEWADYIAFLSRLQKSLQLNSTQTTWIPYSSQVANKLSLCLSSTLPNGVHQKAVSIYDSIFSFLPPTSFNKEINIWLPGLLPLFSYSSIQVKPQLIQIYKNHILAKLEPGSLRIVSKPLILSLLPGLDDENSEAFQETFELVDTLKKKLNDDGHFWQSLLLCIISNPERRLGALYWCNRRLPAFEAIKVDDKAQFSEEAQACLTPESGLLVRAFATSINSSTSFNPAGDIIVIRGFFDLLLSHIPLNSDVFNKLFSSKDKELLIMSCCKVTLKRDMSLNRRLWNWFLGPDSAETETSNSVSQSEYFRSFGLEALTNGLLKLIHSGDRKSIVEAFRISSAVIMDKWELSHLITPKVLSPLLLTCFEYCHDADSDEKELLSAARSFFDGVEASYIWNDIINNIILSNEKENYKFLDFLLKNFDFREEEMVTVHIPLALLSLLTKDEITDQWISIVRLLVDMIPRQAFAPIEGSIDLEKYFKADIVARIKSYYKSIISNENVESPIPGTAISILSLDFLRSLYIKNIKNTKYSLVICSLFCEFLYNIPNERSISPWNDRLLVKTILEQPITSLLDTDEVKQVNLLTAFSISKLLSHLTKSLSPSEKNKLLKIILSNLWTSLKSPSPVNFQVETVKHIFELAITLPTDHIEAGILLLLLQSSRIDRVRAFSILWTHSASFNDADIILTRPLQLLMDDLYEKDSQNSLPVTEFIKSILKSGSTNRLLKLLTNPLLEYEFMHHKKTDVVLKDDLNQFSYYLKTVLNVIKSNEKPLCESFNAELAVMDSTEKLQLIKANDWDISTYKSLVLHVSEKFIKLNLTKEVLDDEVTLRYFYDSIATSLNLLSTLTTGNEAQFSDRFHLLIEACSSYINLPYNKPYEVELIEKAFLKTILKFLKLSDSLKINLNLLHIEDEGKEPLLVRFIIQGITKAQSSVLLESWFELLTKSLYLFNDSVFSVILPLNDAIINKIDTYFQRISSFDSFSDIVDVESSFNILTSGLEDLLSISHSYLLTSKFKSSSEKPINNNTSENGFFGNVIQGVFQIESPAIRTTEQNKLYSILLSFQDAVRVAFLIWKWADSKPQAPTNSISVSDRSVSYFSNKLKFRTKNLLGTLMGLERQEVIETLIDIDLNSPEVIKILNVLDGGRSQITIPHILNSITTRTYPQLLDEKCKSSLNVTISARSLSQFLLIYMESIDNDTVNDIWDVTQQFLRDVILHSQFFKPALPELLKTVKALSLKLGSSRFVDQRKIKKELSEVFIKLLNAALASKSAYSEFDISNKLIESGSGTDSLRTGSDDVAESISSILKDLDVIIQDSDKVNAAVNSILVNLVTPQIKSKKINKTPSNLLRLINDIGQFSPSKAWKALVFDIFMDDSFFNVSPKDIDSWKPIIGNWISNDKEKLGELVSRVTPSVQSSTSNIFIWNEKSEVEGKILTLKRISYLIMIQPQDFFINNLESILERVEYSLSMTCPAAYRSEISNLFRAISLKFGELHLLPCWTTIVHELADIFESLENKSAKELSLLTEEELNLTLNSSKLLDQMLLLKYDEFNLNEWLFVSTQTDVANGASKKTLIAIADKIASKVEQIPLKDTPIRVKQPSGPLQPLLIGVKSINSIVSLRNFFDSLSLISYERVYGLYGIDLNACEASLMEDLVF